MEWPLYGGCFLNMNKLSTYQEMPISLSLSLRPPYKLMGPCGNWVTKRSVNYNIIFHIVMRSFELTSLQLHGCSLIQSLILIKNICLSVH